MGLRRLAATMPAWQRALTGVAVVGYVVGLGVYGWWLAWPPPPVLPGTWADHTELSEVWGEHVGWGREATGPAMSYSIFPLGDDGRLVIEALYADQPLPPSPPSRSRPLTPAERHAADIAFARGEEAFRRFADGLGLPEIDRLTGPWPHVPIPTHRDPVLADLTVDCVRLVVSGEHLDDPDPQALDGLLADLEERVADWVDGPAADGVCDRRWGYRR